MIESENGRIHGTGLPVLLLTFNRPDCTYRVLQSIREHSPPRLYISSDGGRNDSEQDLINVLREEMLESIDWDCRVEVLYQDRNLGCRVAVTSALNWFFENEERGIILEDDCLPHPAFFEYCAHLLRELQSDDRYASISGTRFLCHGYPPRGCIGQESRVFHCWGWASWRRAWNPVDITSVDFDRVRKQCRTVAEQRFWRNVFDICKDESSSSWAYRYSLQCFLKGKRHIIPPRNLVLNIGFQKEATHSTGRPFIAFKDLPPFIDISYNGEIQSCASLDESYYRTRFRAFAVRQLMRMGYWIRDLVDFIPER